MGDNPVVDTLTLPSPPPPFAFSSTCVRNDAIVSRDMRMSLNIPSIFDVNWYPQSVLSFTMKLRSASSLVVFPPSRRFAR